MGYWGEVHRLARAEVLELLKLKHTGQAAFTVALIVVPAAITWSFTADTAAWVRALSTVGATALVGAFAYGVKMLTIPPQLAAEAAAQRVDLERQLASFDDPDDDAWLREGLAYAHTGRWGDELWEAGAEGVNAIAERVRKLAVRGRLHVWGTSGRQWEVPIEVPTYFLQATGFDFLSLTSDHPETVRTEKNGEFTPSRWHALRINRAEFEREFLRKADA